MWSSEHLFYLKVYCTHCGAGPLKTPGDVERHRINGCQPTSMTSAPIGERWPRRDQPSLEILHRTGKHQEYLPKMLYHETYPVMAMDVRRWTEAYCWLADFFGWSTSIPQPRESQTIDQSKTRTDVYSAVMDSAGHLLDHGNDIGIRMVDMSTPAPLQVALHLPGPGSDALQTQDVWDGMHISPDPMEPVHSIATNAGDGIPGMLVVQQGDPRPTPPVAAVRGQQFDHATFQPSSSSTAFSLGQADHHTPSVNPSWQHTRNTASSAGRTSASASYGLMQSTPATSHLTSGGNMDLRVPSGFVPLSLPRRRPGTLSYTTAGSGDQVLDDDHHMGGVTLSPVPEDVHDPAADEVVHSLPAAQDMTDPFVFANGGSQQTVQPGGVEPPSGHAPTSSDLDARRAREIVRDAISQMKAAQALCTDSIQSLDGFPVSKTNPSAQMDPEHISHTLSTLAKAMTDWGLSMTQIGDEYTMRMDPSSSM